MRTLFKLIVVVAVGWIAWKACAYEVDESRFAIVQRFGSPRQVIEQSGLYFKLPPPIEQVQFVDRRVHVLDPAPNEYLTSDKKNVMVNCFAIWTVKDPKQYWVSVGTREGAEARLSDLIRSAVGTALGQTALSSLVSHEEQSSGLDRVAQGITRATATAAAANYGIEVRAVRFKRIGFPMQNRRAVFNRMQSERERIAKLFRSEGEEEADKIRARADREREDILSQARRKAEELRGSADAEATRIYAASFGEDPEFYGFVRALEAYPKIIQENSTVVLPSDSEILQVLSQPPRQGKARASDDPPERGN